MDSLIETAKYRGLTIELYADYDYSLADGMGDEPVNIVHIEHGRAHTLYSGSKRALDNAALILALDDEDSGEWADYFGHDLADAAGAFGVSFSDADETEWFETAGARWQAMLAHDGFESARVRQIRTNDTGRVYVVWDQTDLDKYAGMADAKAPIETVQAFFDGEVYGFVVSEDGETLESCWGFVGDSDYCLSEARAAADSIMESRRRQHLAAVAKWARNRVPLPVRQSLLAALPRYSESRA